MGPAPARGRALDNSGMSMNGESSSTNTDLVRSEAAAPADEELVSKGSFEHVFHRGNTGRLENEYDVNPSKLGEGGFGSVFLAKCKHTSVERAVKAIALESMKDPAKFQSEIDIAKKLDHPNIVRLYETFKDAQKVYLVMELCTGGELFDHIIEDGASGFDEMKAGQYVRQMFAAICYLHSQSFAHRDIKPENFLFQNKNAGSALKIIDFGLACQFKSGIPMSTKVGTAYYVAPEVLKGQYDEKCDVWGIGVVTFILLCGSPPFAGNNDRETFKKVKAGIYSFNSPDWDGISSGAKDFIKLMLTSDPAKRPAAKTLIVDPWILQHGAVAAAPLGQDFVKRLTNFTAISKLKQVVLTVMAQQLPDEDLEPMQNTFRALDTNGDGMLSPQEVREGMLKHDMEVPTALEDLLSAVDTNDCGQIDYSEFLAATLDHKLYTKRDVCWGAFRQFDLDGDGKITHEELTKVLNGDDVKMAIGARKIAEMIKEVDKDGDGTIDFEEFLAMMETPTGPVSKRIRTE